MYQVVDAAGRLIELDDNEPCPDGCSLRVPTLFMDSSQRAVMRDAEQQQRCADAYAAFKDRVGAGMRRHRVAPDPQSVADGGDDPRTASYLAMKRRLGVPKARRQPKPKDPSWMRL